MLYQFVLFLTIIVLFYKILLYILMILSTKFGYQFLFTFWLLFQLKIYLLELSLHFTTLLLVIIHAYLLNIIIVLNVIVIIINVAVVQWLVLEIIFVLLLPILKIHILISIISWVNLIIKLHWIVLEDLLAHIIGLKYFLGCRWVHHLGVVHFKLGSLYTWN